MWLVQSTSFYIKLNYIDMICMRLCILLHAKLHFSPTWVINIILWSWFKICSIGSFIWRTFRGDMLSVAAADASGNKYKTKAVEWLIGMRLSPPQRFPSFSLPLIPLVFQEFSVIFVWPPTTVIVGARRSDHWILTAKYFYYFILFFMSIVILIINLLASLVLNCLILL